MNNLEKSIKITTTCIKIIPGLNTAYGIAQALYRLAHKVDMHNPVAPGLKATVKIHLLSDSSWSIGIESIPIVGNLIALGRLIHFIVKGVKGDFLIRATVRNDEEVIRLCLANNPLSDPDRQVSALKAACFSPPLIFQRILNSRNDWDNQHLAYILLYSRTDERFFNKTALILNYCETQQPILPFRYSLRAFEKLIWQEQFDLAKRVLDIYSPIRC